MSDPIKLPPIPNSVVEAYNQIKTFEPVIKSCCRCKDEEERTLRDQVEITEIEAAPFHEEDRAKDFAQRLKRSWFD